MRTLTRRSLPMVIAVLALTLTQANAAATTSSEITYGCQQLEPCFSHAVSRVHGAPAQLRGGDSGRRPTKSVSSRLASAATDQDAKGDDSGSSRVVLTLLAVAVLAMLAIGIIGYHGRSWPRRR